LLGLLPTFRRDPPGTLLQLAREYGDVVYFRLGPQRAILFNRPAHVQDLLITNAHKFTKSRLLQRAKILLGEGLLTNEGKFHLRQRRLAQPAFHRDRLKAYSQVMAEYADRAATRWQEGETRDMAQEMMRLTLAVVAKTLFSADVESEASEVGQALTDVLGLFDLMLVPGTAFLQHLPLPAMRRFNRALKQLNGVIYGIIQEHRRSGKDAGDLLSMLMMAADDQGDGSRMNDKQLRDEAMTLFLAGHETTAVALTWTWYLLSQHPQAAAKLREELLTVLDGRLPAFDDLPRLPYTEMVMAESMRLYPPAWGISRLAVEAHEIDGFPIAKGTLCLLSPYVMHRNPAFFPDPERFDPERWTPEARETRPKYSYFPFGAGARICIGERFAWTEGILILATIAQKWKMNLAPDQQIAHLAQITLRTRYGMRMQLSGVNLKSRLIPG
jgi:cytochrome P450